MSQVFDMLYLGHLEVFSNLRECTNRMNNLVWSSEKAADNFNKKFGDSDIYTIVTKAPRHNFLLINNYSFKQILDFPFKFPIKEWYKKFNVEWTLEDENALILNLTNVNFNFYIYFLSRVSKIFDEHNNNYLEDKTTTFLLNEVRKQFEKDHRVISHLYHNDNINSTINLNEFAKMTDARILEIVEKINANMSKNIYYLTNNQGNKAYFAKIPKEGSGDKVLIYMDKIKDTMDHRYRPLQLNIYATMIDILHANAFKVTLTALKLKNRKFLASFNSFGSSFN